MRIVKRFLLLLLLIAFSLTAVSCGSILKEAFRSPKVRVASVALTSDPRDNPKAPWAFLLTLTVDNPNGYPLNVVQVAYSAVVGGDTISEGDHSSAIRIEASQITTVQVPLAVRPKAFENAIRRALSARRLDYEFNGSVALQAPIVGVVRVPFSKSGTLDALDLLKEKGFGLN